LQQGCCWKLKCGTACNVLWQYS